MNPTVNIQSELITWAIARAGYDMRDFLDKYPKTQQWLDGEQEPAISQLRKFAGKVHLPFGYLLLDQPPEEEFPVPFLPNDKRSEQ